MQWVQKAVQYYKDINPATLTGAIDVIVVERPTEAGDVELACSPFHVRFGKLSVLRPIDKKVRITVNGQEIPFYMKVGETGEAFFVFETDADVPEDLQTSPIAGPVPDDEDGEVAEEPDFLDLNATGSPPPASDKDDSPSYSPSSSPSHSRYVSMNPTQLNSPTDTIRQLPSIYSSPGKPFFRDPAEQDDDTSSPSSVAGEADEQDEAPPKSEGETARAKAARYIPATVALGVEKAAGIGTAALTGIGSTLGHNPKLKHVPGSRLFSGDGQKQDGLAGEEVHSEASKLEPSIRQGLRGLELNELQEQEKPEAFEPGDEVRQAARDRDADVSRVLHEPEGTGAQHTYGGAHAAGKQDELFERRKDEAGDHLSKANWDANQLTKFPAAADVVAPPEKAGDLMLDMSGYKLEGDETEDKEAILEEASGRPSLEINAPLDERAEEEMVAFTKGLLQSTDPKTLRGFFDPSDSDAASSRAASPPPLGEREDSQSSMPRLPRATSITSLQSLVEDTDSEPAPTNGVYQSSPNQFSLQVGDQVHTFELSLCGKEDFGHSPMQDELAFVQHQVTFSEFMESDAITDHADLVVRYRGRYLTWDNASPVLASLAVYRKSLVDHPEHHRPSQETKVTGRGWGLWWSRKPETSVSLPPSHTSPPVSPPISVPPSPKSLPRTSTSELDLTLPAPEAAAVVPESDRKHYAKTLRLTSDQLKELGLKKGMNEISFSVRSSYSGFATCTSRVFLWESDFSVVISDIDGTITKSDALGHVFTMIGRDWTHLGVAKLYTDIARNGYKMMYLTSRAIGQADTTREYLKGIKQNGFQLPDGPVIMSPDRLMTSLHREVIMRKPEVFKMACLRDIQRLFHERSPFYAGFGNRITDALSYRTVDIPSSRIFTIDTNGEVKMELLELAGYKSSYIHMHDLVDQMFPPINRASVPEYTDFNFWRAPVMQFDLPDLSPPSPALSARSDSSRLTFPRLGSLASSLSRRSSKANLVDQPPSRSTRAGTPSSPLLQATLVEEPAVDDDDLYDDEARSESESMPGSLPSDNDFERLRAQRGYPTAAEVYKESVIAGEDEEPEEDYDQEEEEEEGENDFGDQLDFSSVPYL